MLRELIVENLGVIQRAELELGPGTSAVTGETGAGKTLLVSAMGLVMGQRADSSLIRSGAAQARVEALFRLPPAHPLVEELRERDLLEAGETDLVITRTVSEGGGKVRINGRLSNVTSLAELATSLVEIAGQHDQQTLNSRSRQRALLDAYAGPETVELARSVAESVRAANEASGLAERLLAGQRERERELDVLRYEIEEISSVMPEAGESEILRSDAERLEHAEAIAAAIEEASTRLDAEGGAADLVRAAAGALGRVSTTDAVLDELRARLDALALELDDVSSEMAARRPSTDPANLAAIRDRLGALSRLQRKYGEDDATVLTYLQRAGERIDELEGPALDVEQARSEAEALTARALEFARRLSELRAEAAPRLADEVSGTLASLAMEGTALQVVLSPADLHEGGLDIVELRISSPGHDARPIARIASGGELSRIALALRLAAGAGSDPASTMIFDEVDAGVGGEAARAVGERLADLASSTGVQVLVVTHLPQVAAFADRHHRVRKDVVEGATTATVETLEGGARVEELSRMLAGLPDSERAREHAQELLEMAAGS